MRFLDRSGLRIAETVFAVSVFVVYFVMATETSVAYPSRPTFWTIPVNPELLIPGALGLIALIDALTNGFTIWAVIVGALGALTVLLASVSVHALYADTVTGLFGGGLLTLTTGGVLAILILVTHSVKFALDRFDIHLRRSV